VLPILNETNAVLLDGITEILVPNRFHAAGNVKFLLIVSPVNNIVINEIFVVADGLFVA
jgi:hypothetical protein